jgi:hypothetical protein
MKLSRARRLPARRQALFVELLEDRRVMASGIGVFDPWAHRFLLRETPNAGTANAGNFVLNATGTYPVTGDWNGDGQDDFGVFDSSTGTWSLRYGAKDGDANAGSFRFGNAGSIPVVGDWNGDGRDDIGVFQAGKWFLRYGASPGIANAGVFTFGTSGLLPVAGDWDGDGRDGIGLYNPQNATWTLKQTAAANGASAGSFTFGTTGGLPVTGDWNGDHKDGIGVFQTSNAQWSLRQTANAGTADAGSFVFGTPNLKPVAGDFTPPAAPADALATVVLPPINLDLVGLEVRTSPITVTVSTSQGDGKLLGNLLNTVSTLVDLNSASSAVNTVLDSTVNLLNSADLHVPVQSGSLDSAAARDTQVLELFVAPVHLDLLGVEVDTSTIRVTITTKSGQGQVLGNALNELLNLFNPPLPDKLSIDTLNQKLDDLLTKLNQQLPGIAPAPTPAVPISNGQILNVTVPALDLNLLGLMVETSPITVNASAHAGDGALLGNVLTTALKTLDATPQALSSLSTHVNAVLGKVVGVLNSADLTIASSVVANLPPALQTLLSPTLTAPAGSTAPILDLLVASSDGSKPPVDVELLGLSITTSDIEAHLSAKTGDGQVLGNLLYNLANLADPGGPAGLLNLLNLLGSGSLDQSGATADTSVTPVAGVPADLLTITLKPLNIDLLGLQLRTDPIVVHLSTQDGDGKLLGNLLEGITTLINVDNVNNALNQVLSTTVDLLNSASLAVNGVGSGTFDTAPQSVTSVLDLFVAPVHLDLLGLLADTAPIHLTLTAVSGQGQVLGNVLSQLANVFNPPLPDKLSIDDVNARLAALLTKLNQQIPSIDPAPSPPVNLAADQFLQLTVPKLDVNLLGLLLQTTPITVNAYSHTGNGLLLGNVLTTALNTVDATPENLTGLSSNLNALLAKVVGVLNAATLVLPSGAIGGLPSLLQTLANPTLVSANPAQSQLLDLVVQSQNSGPPVDVDLLGLQVTTSNIHAQLLAQTGDGQVLGNLLYNVANLLNPGNTSTLLSLLTQLGKLPELNAPLVGIGGSISFTENAIASFIAERASIVERVGASLSGGKLSISLSGNANVNDRLIIRNQGTAAGQIGVSGSNVTYGGTVIGTFTGGTGSTPLVITFNAKATVAAAQALLQNIQFRSLGDALSTATRTLTVSLVDALGQVSTLASKTILILPQNDAPVLDNSGNPVLTAIDEDDTNSAGTPVANLAGAITDPDGPSALKGIAIVAANGQGRWQFTLDGGNTWVNMSGASETAARLLPANGQLARVRFVPNANFNGDVKLFYRAWDRTQGIAGGTFDLAGHVGGTTAFSTAFESATLTVRAVNDAPVLANIGGTQSYNKNAPAVLVTPQAMLSDDNANLSGGQLVVRITDGAASSNILAIGGAFTVDAQNNVLLNGTVIGKRTSSGIGTANLVVTFNANATVPIAQQLLRAITFRTQGGPTGNRTLAFRVTDGDTNAGGLASAELSKIVSVG